MNMDMGTVGIVVIFACVFIAFIFLLRIGAKKSFPYIKNPDLFTKAESVFFYALDKAIGDNYRLFGKVRVADIVSVKPTSSKSAWQKSFNAISQKHFDFVLCRKEDLTAIAVIELNDKSHQQKDRQDRDVFIGKICEAVGLPLITFPVKRKYDIDGIRDKVLLAVSPPIENPSRSKDGFFRKKKAPQVPENIYVSDITSPLDPVSVPFKLEARVEEETTD